MATKADAHPPIPSSWRQLRALAESAHGMSEKRIGVKHDGRSFLVEEQGVVGSDYVITAEGEGIQKNDFKVLIPGTDLAKLAAIIGKPVPPDGDLRWLADSIFWSLSAVQKFVLPYYASFKEPKVLQDLVDRYSSNPAVVAYIHLPNSEVVEDETALLSLRNASLLALESDGKKLNVVPLL